MLATFGSGCFWCTEAVFQQMTGVLSVVSGYSGGRLENPDYRSICEGTTGHAECIQVDFDPALVSYADLLNAFFKSHDPTTLNRQGADAGTQYRSVIFYHSEEQREAADEYILQANAARIWGSRIVTEVTAAVTFFPAETYHQDYFRRNPDQGYCLAVIAPKVLKFQKDFGDKLRRDWLV